MDSTSQLPDLPPVPGSVFSRTECVYAAGAPRDGITIDGDTVRYRDFAYVGILTEKGKETGVNRGVVDIDLNRSTGSGTIRGTLVIRDADLGDLNGGFEGTYRDGMWEGRGWASGSGSHAGRQLTMGIAAEDPSTCPDHPKHGAAIDRAIWLVVITELRLRS